MIPVLTRHGVLPPGVHAATLSEVETTLAINAHRCKLWLGFTAYLVGLLVLKRKGMVKSVVFGGSFLTSKETPKDIDILVEGTRLFGAALRADPRMALIFDHGFTEPLGVQAKPWNPGARPDRNLLMLWQKPSDEDVRVRGLSPIDTKGVLQVTL